MQVVRLPKSCSDVAELQQWLQHCRTWCEQHQFVHALNTSVRLLCCLPVPPIYMSDEETEPLWAAQTRDAAITVIHDLLMVVASSVHCVKGSHSNAFEITIAAYTAAAALHHLVCQHDLARISTQRFVVAHDSLVTLLCGDPSGSLSDASPQLHHHASMLLLYYSTVMGRCERSDQIPVIGLPEVRWKVQICLHVCSIFLYSCSICAHCLR